MKTFSLDRHQDKANAYLQALRAAGYARVVWPENGQFHLAHLDQGDRKDTRRKKVQSALAHGKPVFCYPHHARPTIEWDGVYTPMQHAACFVQAEGHKAVMEHFYPHPIEVTGWTYSEVKPSRGRVSPTEEPIRVLFAPIHPFGTGFQGATAARINQEVYDDLAFLHRGGVISLHVRHVNTLAANGIVSVSGPTYEQAVLQLQPERLEAYDVVVGHQTIAYMAVALGIPTVMFGQDELPEIVFGYMQKPARPANWDKYKVEMRYPVDIADDADTFDLLLMAISSELAFAFVSRWRDKFIGKTFDPKHFVKRLERYL